MADKELRAHLKVTGENAVKKGLKDVGDEAAKTGDKFGDLAKDTDHLAESAAKAEAEYRDLIKVFQQTGDLDKKSLNRAKREMRFFDNLKKELEAELKAAAIEVASPSGPGSAGGIIGEGLAKGIGAAIAAGGPYLIAGLGAVAAGLLPFIGGVVASAVLGGVGVGGIAGGIALAAKDSRVEAAASNLAGTAAKAFESAADPFIATTVDSLHTLERASQDVASGIGQGFRTIAPTMKPLTDGIIGLVNEAMPGLIKGFEAAKPVIRAIANELPDIGEALGDFIGIIAEDTDGAVMAFAALSNTIQFTLRFTGLLIANLSKVFEWSVSASAAVTGVLEDVLRIVGPAGEVLAQMFGKGNDWVEGLQADLDASGDASKDFAGNLRDVAKEADNAEKELKDMEDAINDLFGVTMNLDKAVLAYKQNLIDSRNELADGTRTLDLNTQAGRDNMETVLNRIGIIDQLRDSESKSTLGVIEANKRYEERIGVLRNELLQMGFNRKAVDELIARYLAVPKAVEVKFNLTQGGSAAAWSAFRALERQGAERAANSGPGGFQERAMGGPTRAGRTYLVGENGPELWSENANGFITPAAQTAALMSGASGGAAAGQSMVLSLAPSGGSELERVIWEFFAQRLRLDGGAIGQFRIPRST